MARDISLFETVCSGRSSGSLRIYGWDEPAVTSGRHQADFSPADPTLSIPVVSRPTGGGAVLHGHDLTYCISAPLAGPLAGSVVETYGRIAAVFARALGAQGVEARLVDHESSWAPVCFSRAAEKELVVEGVKVMGAAQYRRRGFFLEQGVLPLTVDAGLYRRVFGEEPPGPGLLDLCPSFDVPRFLVDLREFFVDILGVTLADGHEDQGECQDADAGKVDLG